MKNTKHFERTCEWVHRGLTMGFSAFLTKNSCFRQLLLMVLQACACGGARTFDFHEKSKRKMVKYSKIFEKTRAKLRKKWYNK